jgi:hypothetical protein
MTERRPDLERELRGLASAIDTGAPSPGLVAAVVDRVATEPVPQASPAAAALARTGEWARARLRWLVAALLALTGVGVAVSPVGAQVAEWFDLGGVAVTVEPGAPTGSPDLPAVTGGTSLDEAATEVGFVPSVPVALGPPDELEVAADRRLVSMGWTGQDGTFRLDQFEAELSPFFWKSTIEAQPVTFGGHDGLWLPVPHEVVVLDEDGQEAAVPARLAAQTLIWVAGDRTYRLEGEMSRARALEIAGTVR